MKDDPKQSAIRFGQACIALAPHGWLPVGVWLFERNGERHDLSASDIGIFLEAKP